MNQVSGTPRPPCQQPADGRSPALPLVQELRPPPDPEQAFQRLASLPHCLFLDSALPHAELGRYSFLAADPFAYEEVPLAVLAPPVRPGQSAALAKLATAVAKWPAPHLAGLPPFQGGAAGLLSYDLGRELERLAVPRCDEFGLPALAVGYYDVVLAYDHQQRRAWLVSQGFPAREAGDRRARAADRLREFAEILDKPARAPRRTTAPPNLPREALAPQFACGELSGLTSNFSALAYQDAVARAIEYIRAGDIFQVNLAQRLLYPAATDAVALYLRLRRRNPATFAGYFDLGGFQLASASPERFLQVRDGDVEARPIKGTRRRSHFPEADLFAGSELAESQKDRAENVMIVDLLRNDLSRVCEDDSVRVTQLCGLETYQYVQHLVSAVRGRLRGGCTALDALAAAFPGGSVTGAPKVRAMEIIAELEPTARGAYCGSLFYLGFDGTLDANLLIRTITCGRGWWQLPVGGGIVAQSHPLHEYEETWHKAEGLLRALE